MPASPCPLIYSSIYAVLLLIASPFTAEAFEIFEDRRRQYEQGEKIVVEVDSVTSSEAQVPFLYYSLPFCHAKGGLKKRKESLGAKLSGLGRFNSPYELRVNVHEEVKEVCADGSAGPLTRAQVQDFKDKVDKGYTIQMAADGIPLTTFNLTQVVSDLRPGFDLGAKTSDSKDYVIFNHLAFKVLIHKARRADMHAASRLSSVRDVGGTSAGSGIPDPEAKSMWEVVGFEVMPCSIKRLRGEPLEDIECRPWGDPRNLEPQVVAEGEHIMYTYDVSWHEVDIKWTRRWDAYLHGFAGTPEVQWFSVRNALLTALWLSVLIGVIFMHTVRRNLAENKVLRRLEQGKEPAANVAWMLVACDVFREPAAAVQLASFVGAGVHVFCTFAATLVLAALGMLSPTRRGALLTTAILLYTFLSVIGGFSAVWLWRNMARSGSEDSSKISRWGGVCFQEAVKVPGAVLSATFLSTFTQTILEDFFYPGLAGAVPPPFPQLLRLYIVWVVVSVPLAFLGGHLASRMPLVTWPTRTTKAPSDIPAPRSRSRMLVLFMNAVAGLLPFLVLTSALHYVMPALWQGYFFDQFGFLLTICGLAALITAQLSVIHTNAQLDEQEFNWWWQSFHRGGSTALYLLGYSCFFLMAYIPATALHPFALVRYTFYMAVVAYAAYLCLGAVGVMTSLAFVWLAYSRLDVNGAPGHEGGRDVEGCMEQLIKVRIAQTGGAPPEDDADGGV